MLLKVHITTERALEHGMKYVQLCRKQLLPVLLLFARFYIPVDCFELKLRLNAYFQIIFVAVMT